MGPPAPGWFDLMSPFMIHKAYLPVHKWSRFLARFFSVGQSEVVQKVLADLNLNFDMT